MRKELRELRNKKKQWRNNLESLESESRMQNWKSSNTDYLEVGSDSDDYWNKKYSFEGIRN
jgi:hypothetical protein